jgi:hypothetical protein
MRGALDTAKGEQILFEAEGIRLIDAAAERHD